MELSQEKRIIAIESAYDSTDLIVTRLQCVEEISRPFHISVQMLTDSARVDASDLVGTKCSVGVFPYGADVESRWFHGFVTSFVAGQADPMPDGYREYEIEIAPWFWLLSLTKNSRIFQDKTAPEILKALFDEHDIADVKDTLKGTYPKLEYCVQYNESDFDFASRLMERFGIYYFFSHEKSRHTMVLGDQVSNYLKADDYEASFEGYGAAITGEPRVDVWRRRGTLKTGKVTLNSYNFETSTTKLESKENTVVEFKAASKFEQYDVVENFGKADDGKTLAGLRIESAEAQTDVADGKSNCVSWSPGYKFKLTSHPNSPENGEYVLTKVKHEALEPFQFSDDENAPDTKASSEAKETVGYFNDFACIPAKTVFRPLADTPRPRVTGLQTAVVTGPSGQDVYVDKFGRVKVQFHWDRDGKLDDKSSCWVRVAHNLAGAQFGSVFHPRVGHEVLIDFIDGDPDRPLVTGSVYNDRNMPPYKLPDKNTQVGLKTRSIDGGAASNFNELRFDDKIGKEEVFFHAERDFTREVKNNDTLKVGFDVSDAGDQTVDIYNDRTVTLDQGKDTLTLKTGDRSITLDKGNHELTISTGDHTVSVEAGSSSTEAAKAIELKVGSNSLKIDQQGVTITGSQIAITGKLKVDITATNTKLNGDASVTIKGGVVKIN